MWGHRHFPLLALRSRRPPDARTMPPPPLRTLSALPLLYGYAMCACCVWYVCTYRCRVSWWRHWCPARGGGTHHLKHTTKHTHHTIRTRVASRCTWEVGMCTWQNTPRAYYSPQVCDTVSAASPTPPRLHPPIVAVDVLLERCAKLGDPAVAPLAADGLLGWSKGL